MPENDFDRYKALSDAQIAAQRQLHEEALAAQRRGWAEQDRLRREGQIEDLSQKHAEIEHQNDTAALTKDQQDYASDKADAKQSIDQQQAVVDQTFQKIGGGGGGGLITAFTAAAMSAVVTVRRSKFNREYPSERRSVKKQRRTYHRKRAAAGRKKYTPPPRPDYQKSLEKAREAYKKRFG